MEQRTYVKHKTIKLLEENVEESICEFEFGDGFLHTTPKSRSIKKN